MIDAKWMDLINRSRALDNLVTETDQYVTYLTDALLLTITKMYTDNANGVLKMQDVEDLQALVDKLGNYSIKGVTIKYLNDYKTIKEITDELNEL